jgi:DNA-binding transcriptional ArsR family regulator
MGDRVEAVFSALADPSRRFVVERLAASGSATPTIGRNTVYRLDPAPLSAATEWIARVGAEWDQRLAALAAHLGREADRTTGEG